MTFNNHSGWKLLKACRKCIFSEYLCTLHVCKHLFLVWQLFFFSLTSLAYVNLVKKKKKKKRKRKKKWWAVLVMFTWIYWNLTWKCNQSSVLMQNNDNFKQLLFCKTPQLHLTPVCSGLVLQADQQAPKGCHQLQGTRNCFIFTQELYLHFSRWSLVV